MSFNYRSSNLLAAIRCWLAAMLLIAVPLLVGGLQLWFHVTTLVIGLTLLVLGWVYLARSLRNLRQRRRSGHAKRTSTRSRLSD